jgi:hypothetical protein
MRLAWVVLVAGCGFQGKDVPVSDPDGAVPTIDAATPGLDAPVGSACWTLDSAKVGMHVCTSATPAELHIEDDVEIDTTTGASTPAGFECVPLVGDSEPLCALVATRLTIDAGTRLSAHGDRPLALLAHDIDLFGSVDVSSQATLRGAGASNAGCNTDGHLATFLGGGGGGGLGTIGGKGGDEDMHPDSRGHAIGTVGDNFRGGCDGTGGGNGSQARGKGGAGGGAVWIATDTGTLAIGAAAVINASGAGGPGGTMQSGVAAGGGGGGGGSGGLILLQAHALSKLAGAQIFANGAHGGGGATPTSPGVAGGNPERASSDGGDGQAGGDIGPPPHAGEGGGGAAGAGGMASDGERGDKNAGGGGGGGGYGVIWTTQLDAVGTNFVSPNPIAVP